MKTSSADTAQQREGSTNSRSEFLTSLIRLRHGSDEIGLRDLEEFIADAVLSVALLRMAFDGALEGIKPDSRTGMFFLSPMQRDVLCHALIGAEESANLVMEAWQMAHDGHVANKQND